MDGERFICLEPSRTGYFEGDVVGRGGESHAGVDCPIAAQSPLLEPDRQISRIRLSRYPSSQAFTATASQGGKTQVLQEFIPVRRVAQAIRALTPTFQVLYQSFLHIAIDIAERLAGVALDEVMASSHQMRVDLRDQHGDGFEALLRSWPAVCPVLAGWISSTDRGSDNSTPCLAGWPTAARSLRPAAFPVCSGALGARDSGRSVDSSVLFPIWDKRASLSLTSA